jgi:hypothetical protein
MKPRWVIGEATPLPPASLSPAVTTHRPSAAQTLRDLDHTGLARNAKQTPPPLRTDHTADWSLNVKSEKNDLSPAREQGRNTIVRR